jgi:hypothetical protein
MPVMGKAASFSLTAASGFLLIVEAANDMRPRQTAPFEKRSCRQVSASHAKACGRGQKYVAESRAMVTWLEASFVQYWRTCQQRQSVLSGKSVSRLCQGYLTKTQDVIHCDSTSVSR